MIAPLVIILHNNKKNNISNSNWHNNNKNNIKCKNNKKNNNKNRKNKLNSNLNLIIICENQLQKE